MAARPISKAPAFPPVPRLYLATPLIADPAPLLAQLPALLAQADIAAVLLRLAPADERGMITRAKAVAGPVQQAGAALLIADQFALVARSGADGAHLSGIAAMEEAMPTLKPDRIAGVGALHTRHDAMVAGEAGADYVLFGEPEHGERPSADAIFERLQWWAEVFETPCVGYAASLNEAHLFGGSGAEFIMPGYVWDDPRGPAAALAEAAQAIAAAHADAFGAADAGR
jgi:thiamine-phosphate pyrophosphorylase